MESIIFWGVIIYIIYRWIRGKKVKPMPVSSSNSPIISEDNKEPENQFTGSTPKSPTKKQKFNEKINIENIKLTEEQEKLFNEIENSHEHFFITGKAGTGKSVLLQFLKQKSKKSLVVGAFTGVAALNVGAQTLNSLFRLPTGFIHTDQLHVDETTAMLLRHIDAVIIDEISMVRADMMDGIDVLLRQARKNEIPFGGVQMIMFGDPYQLDPITGDENLEQYFAHNHGGKYFFNAHVWKATKFNTFELVNVLRQKDDKPFMELLDCIRKEELKEDTLDVLNKRFGESIPRKGVITLATRNSTVDTINKTRLAQLDTPQFQYVADIEGNLERSAFPTEEILRLKKGAQVMLLKNDAAKRWVNGTVGIIDSLSQFEIKVDIDGIVYSIPRAKWSKIRYYYDKKKRKVEEEIISEFYQYPLRLAWAFTIHKSQGKTYESVIIDMEGGAFTHGQTYVALSRCRSLAGLYLRYPLKREDIIVDPVVHSYMRKVDIKTPTVAPTSQVGKLDTK